MSIYLSLYFNVVPNQNPIRDFLDVCQINLKFKQKSKGP